MNITGNYTEDTLKKFWKINQENKKLKKQNKAYENMRKEAIECINHYETIRGYYEYIDEDGYDEYNYEENLKQDFLDILNKVGEDK